MKKALVASIMGLAVVASSYGQGSVFFSTYVGTVYQPIKYSSDPNMLVGFPGLVGQTAGGNVTATLYYALGNTATTVEQLIAVAGSGTAVNSSTAPGYVTGGVVSIPGYSSGPVTFAVYAAVTSGTGAGLISGWSALWVEPSIAANPNPAGLFSQNVPAIVLTAIPEPSTIALAGLGAASLLLIRRRKA